MARLLIVFLLLKRIFSLCTSQHRQPTLSASALSRHHLNKLIALPLLFVIFFLSPHLDANQVTTACVNCHALEVNEWLTSDHAKSMALATNESVVANFDNVEVRHHDMHATFFKKNDLYFATLTQQDQQTTYEISYTFGHYPLQQYLVNTSNSTYQVFPFSWDARPHSEGGQRWFPNYAQNISIKDRLHWQQPLQNWNGMCADCHSTGLKRQYKSESNTFNTVWDEINVSCLSCHSLPNNHPDEHIDSQTHSNRLWSHREQQKLGTWLRSDNEAVAHWEGPKRVSKNDTCYGCHSLREPLKDGITPSKAFLDQFSPSLLTPSLYHSDGQIKEEVYVYGSFLQSKMHAAGVQCIDCHQPHTMTLKYEGNELCAQCHNSSIFNKPSHTHHESDSQGSQCVNCHMPTNTYMSVDKRRDHSFLIPRPSLSSELGVPNACTQCHQDKSDIWATSQLNDWFGVSTHMKSDNTQYAQVMAGGKISHSAYLALVNSPHLAPIKRATLIEMLPSQDISLTNDLVTHWVTSDEPLIRLATARIGSFIPLSHRIKDYAQLLTDKYLAIRIAAAEHLASVGSANSIPLGTLKALNTYFDINSWRAEPNLKKASRLAQSGNIEGAINKLKQAIHVEPNFENGYVALGELYRQIKTTDESDKELALYSEALNRLPNSPLLHYSLGLAQVRAKRYIEATSHLYTAHTLEPDNLSYAYLYILALDKSGNTKQAYNELNALTLSPQNMSELSELGRYLKQKLQIQEQ